MNSCKECKTKIEADIDIIGGEFVPLYRCISLGEFHLTERGDEFWKKTANTCSLYQN